MVILKIFCLIILSTNLHSISCEDKLVELERAFTRRFEQLENENIVLKEELQNLKSQLEQYERLGLEYLLNGQLKGSSSKTGIMEATNRMNADDNNTNNRNSDTDSNSGIRSDTSKIMAGTLQLKRQTYENVAFHAYISGDHCYGSHETFVFDVAVSNYGNGYRTLDGIFDAPMTGVYVLTLTVLPKQQAWVNAEIVMNGSVVGKTVGDSDHSNDYHPGTTIIVIHINAGDHVFVRRGTDADCDVIGDGYARTSFSGWMLF